MASQISLLFAKPFVTRNLFGASIQIREYGRWMRRIPSKVFMPDENNYLKKETVIDITERIEKNKLAKVQNIDKNQDNVKKHEIVKNKYVPKDLKRMRKVKVQSLPTGKKQLFNYEEIDKLSRPTDEGTNIKFHKKPKHNTGYTTDVFDTNGQYIYEILGFKNTLISKMMVDLKSRKAREKSGKMLVEGWRLIADGLQAGCTLEKVIFSRLSSLEKLRPLMPEKGPKMYKMPYKEIQMWSNLDTSPGIMGIFQVPNVMKILKSQETYPINIICDNIREPGNLGSILRACLAVGCRSVILTKGCVDIWDSKVIRSACGAHFRLPIRKDLTWDEINYMIENESSFFIADNNSNNNLKLNKSKESEMNEDSETDEGSSSGEEEQDIRDISFSVPVIPYYDVDFSKMLSITLVIGGETEGISEGCYRFAEERFGSRLNIPLTPGVDSLNSGAAFAVIAFEIKRQLLLAGPCKESIQISNPVEKITVNV